ncbi:MAG: hypothetical protein H0W09_02075 [Solirubrobacterales bacterium]|nr:hypothetical protein [Solirubrobacterales bacterium]
MSTRTHVANRVRSKASRSGHVDEFSVESLIASLRGEGADVAHVGRDEAAVRS